MPDHHCPYFSQYHDGHSYYCTLREISMAHDYDHRDTYCDGRNGKIRSIHPYKHCPYYRG